MAPANNVKQKFFFSLLETPSTLCPASHIPQWMEAFVPRRGETWKVRPLPGLKNVKPNWGPAAGSRSWRAGCIHLSSTNPGTHRPALTGTKIRLVSYPGHFTGRLTPARNFSHFFFYPRGQNWPQMPLGRGAASSRPKHHLAKTPSPVITCIFYSTMGDSGPINNHHVQ